MTAGNPPGGDRTAGPAPPPSDPRQLREEIRRTRAELGDTVEALAGRLDVRARAREAAAAARQRARDRAAAVTRAVADRGAQLKEQIGGAAAQATGGVGGEAAPDRASGASGATGATGASGATGATGATGQARARAVRGGLPLVAVAGVVLVGWLVWRRRRS